MYKKREEKGERSEGREEKEEKGINYDILLVYILSN
jgi:hypothetical protein